MMELAITLGQLFFIPIGLLALLVLFGKVMTRITGRRWL